MSKRQWTIILHYREQWFAHFNELKVDLPLGFSKEATFWNVYESVKRRYPNAVIVFDRIEIEEGDAGCILR
jgi:hypothetical protein